MNIHLIAVHYDSNKNIIGFRLFDSDNKQTMDQPYDAVKNVVASNRINIHGIEYRKSDGKLHGNNGKFDRYPILFNGALAQKSIVIINTIDDSGYTICNFKGNTGEVEKDQLVKYASTSMNIANGKLITKDGNQFISAIQGSYDNISLASTQLGKRVRNSKINREYAKEMRDIRTQELKERKKRPAGLKIYNDPRLPRVITGIPAANSKMKEVDPETSMTVEEKMAYTMIAMKDVRPFYHSIFSILRKVEATPQDNVDTMGVSISTLYFSSDFVKKIILPYLLFVSIHEVCHIGMKHRIRRGNRDFDVWNIACDYYINAAIAKEFGLKEPGDIVEARSILRDKGGTIDPSIKHYKIGLPPFVLFNSKVDADKDTPETIYAELVGKANNMPQDNQDSDNQDENQGQQDNQNQQGNQGQQGQQGQQEEQGQQQEEQGQQQEDQNNGEGQQQNQGNNSEGQGQNNNNGQGNSDGEGQEQGEGKGSSRKSGETLGEENPDTSIDNLDDFSSGKENTATSIKHSNKNNNSNNKDNSNSGLTGQNITGNNQSNDTEHSEENSKNNDNSSNQGNKEQNQGNQSSDQGDQNSQQSNTNGEFGEPYNNDDLKESQEQGNSNNGGNQNFQSANARVKDDSHSQSESNSKKSGNDINEQRKKGRLAGKEFRGQTIPDTQLDMVDDQETEGKTESQLRQKANSILNRAVVIHKQKHKFGGDNADFLERYVEMTLAPKVNWKTLLKNRLTKATQKMNTYSAPDKRFISRNMLMPGPKMMDNDYIENIKICVDTSGSITNAELGMALSQIDQLFRTFKASAELIYWDTRVRAIYQFKEVKELINKKPMGGGGTDANCIFDYFENNPDYKRRRKKKPSVIIIFTDGYIPSVNEKYKKNFRDTIWIISDSENTFNAPFGVVAKLKYDED